MNAIMPSSSGEADNSLRGLLRRETRDAHERVDRLFGSCDFGREGDYIDFLRAQAVAWLTLEPVLDAGSKARFGALVEDLAALGEPVPDRIDAPAVPDAESAGMRYVLEGSRLGSTVLLRELRARSPALADRASAYLTASADPASWKATSTWLQMRPRDDASDTAALNDARTTFGIFERAFEAARSDRRK
jgi:heme oxygenase